jgi:AraC-like DNA-binding protein/predicted enzyme related to lactoylglutathione lyase
VDRDDLVRLRRARDQMDREYARPLDVEALARTACMSSGHFSRSFRAAFGETPYSYLMTRRIERAMTLLRRGDLSVTDVCFEVGCASLGTFSTRFTELVGETPTAYRARDHSWTEPLPACLVRAALRPIRNREAASGNDGYARSGANRNGGTPMKIKLTSVYVDDQEKALRFYTDVLGFTKKADFTNGPFRWLTVASPDEPDGTELQLALNDDPAARAFQQAMFQHGKPAAMFFTGDVKGDYERIKSHGGEFTMPPTPTTGSTIAQLNDTCGNLLQITQLARW